MNFITGSEEIKCYLCNGITANRLEILENDTLQISCAKCGQYEITVEACGLLKGQPYAEQLHLLAGTVKERSRQASVEVTTSEIPNLIASAPRDLDAPEKARRLLQTIALETKHLGRTVSINSFGPTDAYARDGHEYVYLWNYLLDVGWTKADKRSPAERRRQSGYRDLPDDDSDRIQISAKGWNELSSRPTGQRDHAFIAMWFNKETQQACDEGILPAIAGDCHWKPVRIDFENNHNDDVIDRMLGTIRRSRFLVAEFTGHRNGVYFEAGFALGLGIPVVWICRKDVMDKAHFDTSHFNHVIWETPGELREKLANRILATIGEGNYQPLDSTSSSP